MLPSGFVIGRHLVLPAFSGNEQLIAESPEYVIVPPAGAGSAGACGATVGTGAGGGGFESPAGAGFAPRQVIVIALSGCAQFISPFIVSGISLACTPLTPPTEMASAISNHIGFLTYPVRMGR